MDNQDQLPILPDPLEDQPVVLSAPVASAASTTDQVSSNDKRARRNYLRIGLIFGSAVVVLLLVLFGSRLVDLLNLRGTKAGTVITIITIQGADFVNNNDWFEKDGNGNVNQGENRGLFEVDGNGHLILTSLSGT